VPSLVVLIGLVFVGVIWWILQGVQKGTIGAPAVPRTVETTPSAEDSPLEAPESSATDTGPTTGGSPGATRTGPTASGANGATRAGPTAGGATGATRTGPN